MPKVTIYTAFMCPYCSQAKKLLKGKLVEFDEIDVTFSPAKRQEMLDLAGSHTVPQIFVDGDHIGDCNSLHALEHNGDLDRILTGMP
ncbi:MAG: glutaredoxin 3 [Alphaproteobacteria bacterium]|nr:glutaredoxin 3 [Alphaproteobacteria bacterium]